MTRYLAVCLLLVFSLGLASCSTVSNEVGRYEDSYQREYGPAEQAARQKASHPGLVHFEDDHVVLDLTLQELGSMSMFLQVRNKTSGTMTIQWLNVLFEFARIDPILAVSDGGSKALIPAGSIYRDRFQPSQDIGLFNIDSIKGSMDQVGIRIPIRIDATGNTRVYRFTYLWDTVEVRLIGYCEVM